MKKILILLMLLASMSSYAQTQVVTGPKKQKSTASVPKQNKTKASAPKQSGKNSPQPQNHAVKTPAKQPTNPISTTQTVDLGLSVYWCGYNVGAHSPEECGDYYAWGEIETKTTYNPNTYHIETGYNDIRGYDVLDAARANMPGAWRLPTKKEYEELLTKCKWSLTTYKGTTGYKITGPNGKSIFLPMAGVKEGSSADFINLQGMYWCSNIFEDDKKYSWYLNLIKSKPEMDFRRSYTGCTIRAVCIK